MWRTRSAKETMTELIIKGLCLVLVRFMKLTTKILLIIRSVLMFRSLRYKIFADS